SKSDCVAFRSNVSTGAFVVSVPAPPMVRLGPANVEPLSTLKVPASPSAIVKLAPAFVVVPGLRLRDAPAAVVLVLPAVTVVVVDPVAPMARVCRLATLIAVLSRVGVAVEAL